MITVVSVDKEFFLSRNAVTQIEFSLRRTLVHLVPYSAVEVCDATGDATEIYSRINNYSST